MPTNNQMTTNNSAVPVNVSCFGRNCRISNKGGITFETIIQPKYIQETVNSSVNRYVIQFFSKAALPLFYIFMRELRPKIL